MVMDQKNLQHNLITFTIDNGAHQGDILSPLFNYIYLANRSVVIYLIVECYINTCIQQVYYLVNWPLNFIKVTITIVLFSVL